MIFCDFEASVKKNTWAKLSEKEVYHKMHFWSNNYYLRTNIKFGTWFKVKKMGAMF